MLQNIFSGYEWSAFNFNCTSAYFTWLEFSIIVITVSYLRKLKCTFRLWSPGLWFHIAFDVIVTLSEELVYLSVDIAATDKNTQTIFRSSLPAAMVAHGLTQKTKRPLVTTSLTRETQISDKMQLLIYITFIPRLSYTNVARL